MIRLVVLWAAVLGAFLLAWILREERLAARGKIPLGRLRRLWLRPERRRAPRYRVDWTVRYERLESTPPSNGEGKARDISRTGAGLTIAEKLPIGSWIRLEVLPPEETGPLQMTAEVVWLKEIPLAESSSQATRFFFIGIRFRDLDPQIEQRIAQALRGHASL